MTHGEEYEPRWTDSLMRNGLAFSAELAMRGETKRAADVFTAVLKLMELCEEEGE